MQQDTKNSRPTERAAKRAVRTARCRRYRDSTYFMDLAAVGRASAAIGASALNISETLL